MWKYFSPSVSSDNVLFENHWEKFIEELKINIQSQTKTMQWKREILSAQNWLPQMILTQQ